jgi:hypothetical protein
MEFTRRGLLTMAGGAAALGGAVVMDTALAREPERQPRPAAGEVVVPAPFSVAMPIPAELRPVSRHDGVDRYHLPSGGRTPNSCPACGPG